MGAKPQPCYNRIHVMNDRVIMRLQCIRTPYELNDSSNVNKSVNFNR